MKRPKVEIRIAKFRPDPKKSLANFIDFWGGNIESASRSRAALDRPAVLSAEADLLARTCGSADGGFIRLYSDSFIADFEALEMRAMAWLEEQR